MTRNKQNHGQGHEPGMPRLLSGKLCLDFINTVDNHWDPASTDALKSPESLVRWGYHVGLYDRERRDILLLWSTHHLAEAQRHFKTAIKLRAASDRVFRALAHHQKPPANDMQAIQDSYVEALGHAHLNRESGEYHWVIETDAVQAVAWQVARSAVEVLTGSSLERIKECPGCGDCGGLFLDATKSGTRQWCSMEGCGSRAKMRRHYKRQHDRTTLRTTGQ